MSNKNFDETARQRALAGDYEKKVQERINTLKSHLSNAEWDFIDWRKLGRRYSVEVKYAFERALQSGTLPSEYIKENMKWFLRYVLSEEEHEAFFKYVDGIRDYPYSISYRRRSYRSPSYAPYADQLADIMEKCAKEKCRGLSTASYLTRTLPEDAQAYADLTSWDYGYSDYQITTLLDMHDAATEEAVRMVLTSETGGAVTHNLVRGVLRSHRSEYYELVGKLLLAARLQEGVRQVICESADCGTRESFLTLLHVIDENNLIRYSSVKRAVGTWLGLLSEEVRDLERVSDKSVRLIIDCLEHPDRRVTALAGEDAMEIYIALWSYAFESLKSAVEQIERLTQTGTRHQVLVAGYFAAQLDERKTAHRLALSAVFAHGNEKDVLAIWLPSILPYRSILLRKTADQPSPATLTDYFKDLDEAYKFAGLLETIMADVKGKTQTFYPCVFPWFEAKFTKNELAELYCTTAALAMTPDLVDKACPLLSECPPNGRYGFIVPLLSSPKSAVQRRTVLDAIADKESYTRREALKIVNGIHLTEDEYLVLESFLRFKSEEVRSAVLSLLLKQSETALQDSIARLLTNAKEEIRLGGLDLLTQIKSDSNRSGMVESFLSQIAERLKEEDLPSKERILLETFLPKKEATEEKLEALYAPGDAYLPDFETGYLLPEGFPVFAAKCAELFGKYFPDSDIDILSGKRKHTLLGAVKGLFSGTKNDVLCASAKQADEDLLALSQYITDHLEYMAMPIGWGDKPMMLGEMEYGFRYDPESESGQTIPAAELWDAWAIERGMTCGRIVRACLRYKAWVKKTSLENDASPMLASLYGAGFDAQISPFPQLAKVNAVLQYMSAHVPAIEKELLGAALGLWFMNCVPEHMVMAGTKKNKVHLLTHEQLYLVFSLMTCRVKECLAFTFPIAVAVAERCLDAYRKTPKDELAGSEWESRYIVARPSESRRLYYNSHERFSVEYQLIDVEAYISALYYGIINEAQFYEFAIRPEVLSHALFLLTSLSATYCDEGRTVALRSGTVMWADIHRKRALRKIFGGKGEIGEEEKALLLSAHKLCEKLLPTILEPEYRRGDSPAKYSKYITSIRRVTGADQLVSILEALGNDTLNRTSYFYFANDNAPGRNTTLTHLLSVCVPSANDNAEGLRKTLSGKKITEKRLIEAALYAPEWIPIIGEYLEIDGFESVCYYFIAHMNEKFDDKRRAVIARYTPLDEEELNQGAFDRAWFESAYASVGEKRFEQIYAAAKYISDGAKHARARKYADACLGKYTIDELEAAIAEKRNKDLLMAYALAPSAGEDDICRRYLYIGKFRKESKKFGSQRAASEAKAADIALTNLAQTAGYSDTMRLTLRMETKLMDDNRELLRPHTIDDIVIEPVIGDDGKTEIVVSKDGKPLKSIPAKLKKNETVIALTELKKTLTEQYRRTRLMFEEAMECETAFTMEETSALFAHPVVKPILDKLVFVSGEICGFPIETGLKSADGTEHRLAADAKLTVAHPYTLFKFGVWREYQAYLYEHNIVQAFRQIFRELYVKTADEKGTDHSLRYAGHQIQPSKTVSVLKSRRWVADVEDGLQKVYYKENIVARIYAMADWFSPADIEAPTLEWVEFVDRHTGKTVPIDDIPDILFSEVMRDVDLAVSVAHVGGVDPEASHSTVEMREAILSFVLPMFRLSNVKVENGRAVIDGNLANYTVHLGSGVVHQIGGTMIPVLPVHSQHRGRVFLPFVDEDPKTAEIMSKVILFAEDDKIKDPMILSEIQR